MPDIIQLLPDFVANQIAAGEVVQRPSSAVKELLENAIDADAKSIKLLIKDAGKTLIQVIDNGKGMSPSDARLCFERHATSKIKKAQDLFNIHTKGFRGEALASIAAVAHVELKTKQDSDELGIHLKIEGSKLSSQEPISAVRGTNISVKNLFFNIPARRNFLKSDAIETKHIVDEFQRVALSHPNIDFLLQHNNNEIYHLKKSNLRKRIVAVFGSKMDERLVPVKEKTDLINISGFVVKPKFAKKKRGEQFFFVNNRFVKSPYLNHAVTNAFEGLLDSTYHPSFFLYLKLPTKSIDINIHPTKTEIKFENEKALYAIIRSTIKHSLGQYNVAPVLDFNRDATLDTPYSYSKNNSPSIPPIRVDSNYNPFKNDDNQKNVAKKEVQTNNLSNSSSLNKGNYTNYTRDKSHNWEALYTDIKDVKPEKQNVLFEDSEQEPELDKTFQIQNKYLLSSIKSGVVLINQHLAHQRVLYEDFLENITVKDVESQQLLFPVSIPLSGIDFDLLCSLKSELESAGFILRELTKDNLLVEGIPLSISESQIALVLEQLLDDIKMNIPHNSFSHFDTMAKSFAKSLAVKTGTSLTKKEQEDLVNRLFSCKEPSVSPFDKPIFKTLSMQQIDNIFNK
ncbi:MAG: DNA mismatch repair endonuclease MutL [Tenacibaculum sp.]